MSLSSLIDVINSGMLSGDCVLGGLVIMTLYPCAGRTKDPL
jgi:hypothetical protein